MKKKIAYLAILAVLSSSMVGAAVSAKSDNAGSEDKQSKAVVESTANSGNGNSDKDDKAGKGNSSVTDSTYGPGQEAQGYKGLLNAIENVKDKPAGAVLADLLLTRYDFALTDAMKTELQAIQEKDAALSAAADLLDKKGNVNEAVYVQKEAVKANVKNLDSYKKLGKLLDKVDKTGVKLYVNGEEPKFEVPPFIRDGSTLVPFRAISEALKADVSWNPEERSVTVTRGDITVKLFIDSKTAYVNGQEITLEVPAAIVEGSTVVPVRFVSEALKAAVEWEAETQFVVIYEQQ
ncbi:copper amine oxidase N-terminal domain-containing protein [Paenibacillus mesophilus]|uniref:copper amine oxidase N-terminal domain-containing protein n=1 Tax=Paenibacillus mesophilus TaxID=2582849 RepID=UPI00110E7A65|nr:copper amine oxidase N-terminal domain-containing protein [Paenibacillus mesophilus]TMV48073.1 copper amine oxidase N-terminal domain-containing protein [Paenibacillus mesophilus]